MSKKMAIKLTKGYACSYCGKQFPDPIAADNCKDGHDLIYVAISKEHLNRLITFIYSKEEDVLPDGLVERLKSYLKHSFHRIK